MKTAITGINGFIGQALKQKLQKAGHEVIGIHRAFLYDPVALDYYLKVEKPDIIYHLAAYGNHYNQTSDYKTIEANFIVLNNILEILTSRKDIRFINVSSSSVNLNHQTFYSATKRAGELLIEAFTNKYGLNTITVYPYSVYGPGEAKWRLIPTIIHSLLTGTEMIIDENATHDWIYIDDCVNALIDPANLLNPNLHIGTGIKTSNIEVVRILEEISGKKLKYSPSTNKLRAYDNDNWVCNKSNISFNYKTPLLIGLEQTFKDLSILRYS